LAALAVRERFKILNDNLSSFLGNKIKTNKCVIVIPKSFDLKLLSALYNDLCDLIQLINSAFTVPLIFVTLCIVSTDVFAAYGILREYQIGSNKLFVFLLIGNSSWISIQYAIKIFLVNAGSSTTNEAERTLVLVLKSLGTLDSFDYDKNDLKSLLIILRSRKKNLENVFFTLDWKLILTVSMNILFTIA
jgi:hypothetical protein